MANIDTPSTAAAPEAEGPPPEPAGDDGRVPGAPAADDAKGDGHAVASGVDASRLAGLRSRIDPDEITVDWEVEGLVEEGEDATQKARWSGPPRDNFVRAHPKRWSTGAFLLDCRDSQGRDAEFILHKDIARRLIEEEEPVKAAQVYLLMDRDGNSIYWAVRMGEAAEMGLRKPTNHIKTAMEAIERAGREWVRITWRGSGGSGG
jgi:hypothetical protein